MATSKHSHPPPADLVTGGFPCQPFSNSGSRAGTEDNRYLWPEMFRVIRASNPAWIIIENVFGLITWGRGMVLDVVLFDLETAGYEAWPLVLPACGTDAPHRRDRVWVVAHSDGRRCLHGQIKEQPAKERKYAQYKFESGGAYLADSDCVSSERCKYKTTEKRPYTERPDGFCSSTNRRVKEWPVEPSLGRVAHGVPNRVDRIKALGNAIVPQVAAEIMRVIKKVDPTMV